MGNRGHVTHPSFPMVAIALARAVTPSLPSSFPANSRRLRVQGTGPWGGVGARLDRGVRHLAAVLSRAFEIAAPPVLMSISMDKNSKICIMQYGHSNAHTSAFGCVTLQPKFRDT